jgi:ATP-dependent DNA ligase
MTLTRNRSTARTAAIDLATPPMEARTAEALPNESGWQFEPKWDGFRCLAFKSNGHVDLRAKSGKPLGRYFPDIVTALEQLRIERFVVDGELVIEVDGHLSFEALQLRLHPAASRVAKLATEAPARLILFDMLQTPKGDVLLTRPFSERRRHLEAFVKAAKAPRFLALSPTTSDRVQAERWLSARGASDTDGVVAKRIDGPYLPGERAMIKVKRLRSADCVVGGFRYASNSPLVGSLLLGLYDDAGLLHHVGFTSSIAKADRPQLTKKLEALRKPPGFTGRAPGGPSRWSTERTGEWVPLQPKLVVEVQFDHVTDMRFRHGTTLLRWRPDKAPKQCRLEQLGVASHSAP